MPLLERQMMKRADQLATAVNPGSASALEEASAQHAASRLGAPYLPSLDGQTVAPEFVNKIPIAFARQHRIVGLAGDGHVMPVAIADLDGWEPCHLVARFLNRSIKPVFADASEVLAALNRGYQQRTGQARTLLAGLHGQGALPGGEAADIQVDADDDLLD